MKKFIIALLAAVLAAGTASAYNLNFTLDNESGYDFTEIWLKPSTNLEWNQQYDRLTQKGSSVPSRLNNGQRTKITFDNVSETRRNKAIWDLSVKFPNGKYEVWTNIDLSGIVMLRIDRQRLLHKMTATELLDLL